MLLVPDHLGYPAPFPALAAAAAATSRVRLGTFVLNAAFPNADVLTRRVQELLADPAHRPPVAQQPVPLLLGGHGDRMLRLAATTADIVGFTGLSCDAEGNLQVRPAADLEERVAFVRAAAGERFEQLELNLLVQTVEPARRAARRGPFPLRGQLLHGAEPFLEPFAEVVKLLRGA